MPVPDRTVLIARPRGFCAGVERAIAVVDRLLEARGVPLYVRREIVHNQAVVQDFRRRGVVFVEELDQVPDGATVVFSAHGVAPAVWAEARRRGLRVVDATCPLVSKVHRQVVLNARAGRHTLLIGHAGHDEVLGTLGEAPGHITLVTGVEQARRVRVPEGVPVGYVTQTTLSVDETQEIVAVLKRRFLGLIGPDRSDICFATQNRQDAVKRLVDEGIEHLLVVGSTNSSNSRRLCEVAQRAGIGASLIDGSEGLGTALPPDLARIGLTAGASAPEHLVQEVVGVLTAAGWQVRECEGLDEDVHFALPRELRDLAGPTATTPAD